MEREKIAKFHLPGLFEFYDFYKEFLPIFYEKREYFYDFVEIASIYGATNDCIWSGGRFEVSDCKVEDVFNLLKQYGISVRLTFSNSLLEEKHLLDESCNYLCKTLEAESDTNKQKNYTENNYIDNTVTNGVIISSDLLLDYIKKKYPSLYFVSSTTKVITDFEELCKEIRREDFRYVVPDFRFNKKLDLLKELSQEEKDKVEFLCNECCYVGCVNRKACYENVSRQMLDDTCPDYECKSPGGQEGYRFSKAMENPMFISTDDIKKIYLPNGFSNFKIEGRSLGTAIILEMLLYYLAKPEYHLHIREMMYLDSMLSLF